ncbi:hypothetical protein [Sulfuracidifex metallicus]|uniref:Uncharacterized protein n=1 Tax=Sulfuracidifex metallicus DSM 6482 = JCM 9184 TaxID=523847 RepID=A0A6A9QNE5_SULME|nr:hypothetical protein [Sulfuracidifex metallicus]MUN30064.1 hypothetical protein [Sulfuracidifex metallicus DSM 6482 = JCM 9184]WOE51551.1 hypothetical protein RQ359_000860 [Sulfuracidifex metallicus DSM 6482 = JCM 9184]
MNCIMCYLTSFPPARVPISSIRDYIWWAVKWLREPYHLDRVSRGLSLLSSSPFDERDTRSSPQSH